MNNWRVAPLHVTANNLAKKHELPLRFRMCHGRHPNLKEGFIADCTKKVFSNVTYVPTCRTSEAFDPKKAVTFYKRACKSTKVMENACSMNNAKKKQYSTKSSGLPPATLTSGSHKAISPKESTKAT